MLPHLIAAMDVKNIKDEMGSSIYAGDVYGTKSSDRAQLGRMLGYMVGSLGGNSGMEERIAYYESIGDEVMAGRIRQLYAMEQLVNGFGESKVLDKPAWDILNWTDDYSNSNIRSGTPKGANRYEADALLFASQFTPDLAKTVIESSWGHGKYSGLQSWFQAILSRQSGCTSCTPDALSTHTKTAPTNCPLWRSRKIGTSTSWVICCWMRMEYC